MPVGPLMLATERFGEGIERRTVDARVRHRYFELVDLPLIMQHRAARAGATGGIETVHR